MLPRSSRHLQGLYTEWEEEEGEGEDVEQVSKESCHYTNPTFVCACVCDGRSPKVDMPCDLEAYVICWLFYSFAEG